MQAIDPLAGNIVEPDAGLEGQLREDRQLVGGVGAVDVQGRVGLGVAERLGLAQGLLVRQSGLAVICVRMKLQVPLTIAAMLWTWLAASANPRAWTIGIPPPTLASKATARPAARAWAKTFAPCSARSALLAVTTCLPAASAASTNCKAGSVPPIVSMMMSTSGSSINLLTRRWSAGRRPSGNSRGFSRSRTAAQVQRILRPARRAIRSACSVNSRATPVPTVPRPIKPMVTCFIRKASGTKTRNQAYSPGLIFLAERWIGQARIDVFVDFYSILWPHLNHESFGDRGDDILMKFMPAVILLEEGILAWQWRCRRCFLSSEDLCSIAVPVGHD